MGHQDGGTAVAPKGYTLKAVMPYMLVFVVQDCPKHLQRQGRTHKVLVAL